MINLRQGVNILVIIPGLKYQIYFQNRLKTGFSGRPHRAQTVFENRFFLKPLRIFTPRKRIKKLVITQILSRTAPAVGKLRLRSIDYNPNSNRNTINNNNTSILPLNK